MAPTFSPSISSTITLLLYFNGTFQPIIYKLTHVMRAVLDFGSALICDFFNAYSFDRIQQILSLLRLQAKSVVSDIFNY